MAENNRDDLAREPFKATKIWNELIEHLRTNVDQRRRRWKFQYYENCFRGGDIVEVLHSYVQSNPHLSKDATRNQMRCLCQILLEKRVIESVTVDNNKPKNCNFADGNMLYRFSSSDGGFDHSILSPCHSERKMSRRRSLLFARDKGISRRKSLSFTPKAQKRFADLLMPAATLSPEGANNSRTQETPKKRRRLSLDASLGLRKNKMAMLSVSADQGDIVSEVWFQVAFSQLLQLTEIPFLEDILAPPSSDDGMGVIVISNNVPGPWDKRSENKDNINSSTSNDIWITAGMECIQMQQEFPLPQCADTGYLNVMNIKEAGIQPHLLEFYGSLIDSLIPSNLTDVVDGMLCVLANDSSKVVSCLPLLALMLPLSQRKHLRKLLNFIKRSLDTGSGRFIIKKFASAILPKEIQNKAAGQQLVSLMVRYQQQMFKTPAPLKELFQRNLFYAQRGMCPPMSSKVCQQLTVAEYRKQQHLTTNHSLSELMTFIIDNLHMPLKEKEERLILFQKHHNDVFLLHFPSGEL